MNDDGMLYQRKEVLSTQVDDDLILFDETQGQYFTTTGVGTVIWELLAEAQQIDALCAALTAHYDVDAATCRAEVLSFLTELRDAGLLDARAETPNA